MFSSWVAGLTDVVLLEKKKIRQVFTRFERNRMQVEGFLVSFLGFFFLEKRRMLKVRNC